MRQSILILLTLPCFFYTCTAKAQHEGVVRYHLYLFDNGKTIDIPSNFYYKGNKVIQEVTQLNSVEDSLGRRYSTNVLRYCYTDPEANICTVYTNFSDSAKPVRCYNSVDSVVAAIGKNIYSDKLVGIDSIMMMEDTIITGNRYKRMIMNEIFRNKKFTLIVYFEYGKSLSQLLFYRALSLRAGLPAVRLETYTNGKIYVVEEFETISDSLSIKELRILNLWGKNEKCY